MRGAEEKEISYPALDVPLMVLLSLPSIREATFLFRGSNRLTP
ncbi:hypothetical protein ABZW30_39430 [Kitasatospora sp. NPDC004669]